ncbi:Uncharacterised protein [Brucella anthropi]|nr:Uncharacterised protein [Brucella anthropi]
MGFAKRFERKSRAVYRLVARIALDDPPVADQAVGWGGAHGDAAISFGNRTRS